MCLYLKSKWKIKKDKQPEKRLRRSSREEQDR